MSRNVVYLVSCHVLMPRRRSYEPGSKKRCAAAAAAVVLPGGLQCSLKPRAAAPRLSRKAGRRRPQRNSHVVSSAGGVERGLGGAPHG